MNHQDDFDMRMDIPLSEEEEARPARSSIRKLVVVCAVVIVWTVACIILQWTNIFTPMQGFLATIPLLLVALVARIAIGRDDSLE